MDRTEVQNIEFVLSPYYKLPETEEIIDYDDITSNDLEEISLLKEKKLFFLSNEGGSYYLINPTIRTFLQSFNQPKTIVQVTNDFALQSNCAPKQIAGVMMTFLERMCRKGILLTEENAQKLQEITEELSLDEAYFQIGEYIDEYEVIKPLSIREATQLYICKHPKQQEEVVVKTIIYPVDLPGNIRQRSLKKFRQEFKFMEELGKHSNVCHLVEMNDQWKFPFAAIELIEGASLRSYIKNTETSIADKLHLIKQLLQSIAHVQSHHILHGDIHLSNFLVKENKELKLIDFGLSNHDDLQENEIIRNGGVHECIPPERIKVSAFSFLSKRSDFRSEVFQLGVIIYYILYKRYPFSGFTWAKLAQSIQETILDYSSMTFDGQEIPTQVLQVLGKAMEKEPEQRFATAQEMLDAILLT